jgi:TatD DNase family protein
MLIDTHTHLYVAKFKDDRDKVIQRAVEAGVEQFYLPNIDSQHIDDLLALEAAYPKRCFAMMGLHPCSVKENWEEELAIVKSWLERRSFVAIGEIGIDLYWDKSFLAQQEAAFRQQIDWAKAYDIPIVIHSRESTQEVIEVLQDLKDEKLRGIFHCFGGSVAEANAITDLGFYLGIGGVLTFKKSGLAETMRAIDLKHIVLETDAPYLTPAPFRSKRNESAYVKLIAEKLASVKEISVAEVAAVTTENALNIFGKRQQ